MADSKITNLTAVTTPADTDELVVQQSGDSAAKKLTRTQLLADHVAATTSVHGITAAGAALIDDATAGDQRTTLGLGTAATSNTGDFEAAGAVTTHAAVTTSVHGISDTSALLDTGDIGVSVAAEGHTHTLSDVTDAGTAAALDVPASGDAATGEVVKGDDTRLTDARTPTSHNHAGEDITSGTVAAARLGTMTGDSGAGGASGAAPAPGAGDAAAGKYLKADGTWATVSAGIGGTVGSTDNAVPRADGTSGGTLQGSGVTITDANVVVGNGSGASGMAFGGSTSSFPAIGSAAGVNRTASLKADYSGYVDHVANGYRFSSSTGVIYGSGLLALDNAAGVRVTSGASMSYVEASVRVEAHTSGDTLAISESRSEHTNEGAGGEIELTLPTAAAGYDYWFYVQAAQSLKIVAATGDTITTSTGTSTTAGYVRCATQGAYLHLRSINATQWCEHGERGTWTIDS